MTDHVVLVDDQGNSVGIQEKLSAHREGNLHLAFSVMLYRHHNQRVEVLLQQRALSKYHSGGLWANTCCSHPRHHETLNQAAQRRLHEELNIAAEANFDHAGEFIYCAQLDNGMTEHEYDHVLLQHFDRQLPPPNEEEVMQLQWFALDTLVQNIDNERFAVWLKPVINKINQYFRPLQ